jgi:2,4-dienoyl-CoA reductase-like NADH-dependent reductase (Old Yellow Enzyme family)
MCGYIRPGVKGAGYFDSMTEKIKKSVSVPVLLTGGITKLEEAVALLQEGKADLIGVGRALFRDAHWLESQQ